MEEDEGTRSGFKTLCTLRRAIGSQVRIFDLESRPAQAMAMGRRCCILKDMLRVRKCEKRVI